MVLPLLSHPPFPLGSPLSSSRLFCFSSCTSSPFPSCSPWPHLNLVTWTSGGFLLALPLFLCPLPPRPAPALPSLSFHLWLPLYPHHQLFSCLLGSFSLTFTQIHTVGRHGQEGPRSHYLRVHPHPHPPPTTCALLILGCLHPAQGSGTVQNGLTAHTHLSADINLKADHSQRKSPDIYPPTRGC